MSAALPRMAVVGSGAAAAGVLLGIEDVAPGALVTLFERTDLVPEAPEPIGPTGFDADGIQEIQQNLRRRFGFTFPPPKSYFGFVPGKAGAMGASQLWASANRGGLTMVWGAGMLPFSDRELEGWPIDAATLAPHYARIAAEVGVCGELDDVDDYFVTSFVNRPPMSVHPLARAFGTALARPGRASAAGAHDRFGGRFVVGASRLALETRHESERSCRNFGECMLGCPRSAVWSAASTIGMAIGRLGCDVVRGEVRTFDVARRLLVRGSDGVEKWHGPFDRVFLAAGTIGTTAIVLRSGARSEAAPLVDTALASFPVLSLRPVRSDSRGHVALSNLTILAVPADDTERVLQVSVYPMFDHLLRYYLPLKLWGVARRLARILGAHVLIGRVYLGAAGDRTYRLTIVDDEPVVSEDRRPNPRPALRAFIRSLRGELVGTPFRVPPPTVVQATSSHYGCTLPYGDAELGIPTDGTVAPGVHVADAAAFPRMPALSPTFTIMANAHRTVAASLQGSEGESL